MNPEVSVMKWTIDDEGMEYTFIDYSNFPNIKDDKFHELRKAYIDAYVKLKEHIDTME